VADELLAEAAASLGAASTSENIQLRWLADCRYAGQPASIGVDIDATQVDELRAARANSRVADAGPLLASIREGFERNHLRMWNFIKADQPVLLVNLRVQAVVPSGWRGVVRTASGAAVPGGARPVGSRQVHLDGLMQALPVYRRDALLEGDMVDGPAIVEEASSCVIFKSGQRASVDATGNLNIHL